MGATLGKPEKAKEETEEEKYQRRLRAFDKIKNSKHSKMIAYNIEEDLYVPYCQIITSDNTKSLGYYKTIEEAEKRLDDLVLKLYGEIENKRFFVI